MTNNLKPITPSKVLLLITPVIMNLLFVLRLKVLMGDAFIQFIDSSMFVTRAQALKEFGHLWQFNDFGNRILVETTNFYSRVLSFILLLLNIPSNIVQIILYFLILTLVFYVSWFYFNKIITIFNTGVGSIWGSFFSAIFYTYNIQMTLFWGGGLGEAMWLFLLSVPIFSYEVFKSLKFGLKTTSMIIMAIIIGLNTNVIPFNLAFFGVMLMTFLFLDGLSKLLFNLLKICIILFFSLLVGALFVYPIVMLFIFPDPFLSFDPLKSYIFSTNGLNGLFQLFFNWTVKMVWGGNQAFPTLNFYTSIQGILSIFLLWVISVKLIMMTDDSYQTKKTRKFLNFSLLVILISFFLAKGNQQPFNSINFFLYDYIPFFGLFKTPDTKFGTTVIVIFAVFIGYSWVITKQKIIKILLIIALFIHVIPFFSGINFVGTKDKSNLIRIPSDYNLISELINNDNDMGYVLIYPGYFYETFEYKNGYIFSGQDILGKLISKPIVYYENPWILKKSRDTIFELTQDLDTVNLGKYSIRYIIARHDLKNIKTDDSDKSLNQNPYLDKILEVNLATVYKVKNNNYTNIYSFSSNAVNIDNLVVGDLNSFQLDQNFTIPVDILNMNNPIELHLNTSYYDLLEVKTSVSTQIDHVLGNKLANVWKVQPTEKINNEYQVKVVFLLQEYYFVAIFVSIISTSILGIFLVLINKNKKQIE